MIRAVVFDMDGVLFDTERISRDSWLEVADAWNIPGIEENYVKVIGVNHTDGIDILHEAYGMDFDPESFMAECSKVMRRMITEQGIPVKKGVVELLEFLKERKIPVSICSSTRMQTIKRHLEQTGLDGYFDEIIGGDMVEHSKPRPDIYLKACEMLGIPPRDCIAVEDSPNGIRSAAAAGMMPVMVPDLVAPTEELRSLSYRVEPDLLHLRDFLKTQLDN